MPTITVKDLTVTFIENKTQTTFALNGLDAEFLSEKINCVIGASGSGKTTLLKCVAGLCNYDGEIAFDGASVDRLAPKDRGVALVSQEFALYPHMTVFDNIAFPLKVAGCPRAEIIGRVNEIADILDLKYCLTRKPRHLSGGQQQRVALARALVKRPSVCLFDEPMSNLDAQMRFNERRFLRDSIKKYGCTAIYVTHDIPEATALADKLFVLDNGKVAVCGAPQDVFTSDEPAMAALRGEIK